MTTCEERLEKGKGPSFANFGTTSRHILAFINDSVFFVRLEEFAKVRYFFFLFFLARTLSRWVFRKRISYKKVETSRDQLVITASVCVCVCFGYAVFCAEHDFTPNYRNEAEFLG